jgi:hypothetical protein
MTRRKLALTFVAGLAVFLGVLVVYLPASWFSFALPGGVRCATLGGSVWNGECLGLELSGARLGDATWNLAIGRAFSGRLVGDLDVRGAAAAARADFDLSFGGSGELRNVVARFPLDPAFSAQMPRDYRAQISADLKHLVLADGAARRIEGTMEVRELREVRPQPVDLGSYQVSFDGVEQPDGKVLGNLHDLGGPFIIEGTVALAPPNEYNVQGYITGRTADAERTVRQITFGAQPDASGRSEFRFEGTY